MKRHIYLLILLMATMFSCKKGNTPEICSVSITNEKINSINPTSVMISGTYSYVAELDGIQILVGENSNLTNAAIFYAKLDEKNFTATITELEKDKKYYYKYRFVSVGDTQDAEQVGNFTTNTFVYDGHEYVDLGLSVLWSTCNVGANNPEDNGDYYAWGETTTKSNFDWDTYKWCNGYEYSLTKYNTSSGYGTVDGKTVLELADDVANTQWGGEWRMPTYNEMHELFSECTWTWTTINGKNGYRVANKCDNNKYIFLPVTEIGGYYWSSSLYSIPTDAHRLYFNSSNKYIVGGARLCGHSVRPVFAN